jgi:prolyl-tRNA synthetase
VITDVVRKDVKSYRQLPLHFYQVQVKFRDEIRPRFGVMRGREFLMKDGYSFHSSFEDLQREYRNMFDTYTRIFTRLGLKFRAVAADTGSIGGTGSHEFHVLADSGEDALAYCPDSDFAANVELAEALAEAEARPPGLPPPCRKVATPGRSRCEDVAELLGIPLSRTVKAIAVVLNSAAGGPGQFAMILLRGDHNLNELKVQKTLGEFRFARDDEIVAAGLSARLYRSGRRRRSSRFCRSQRGGDGRLRLRRQRSRLPPDRSQLFARCRRADAGRRFPECRCRRPVARRPGLAGTLPWHRGGPHLPVAYQIRRGAQMQLSRRERPEPDHGNGLLRHWRHPHRRSGHRAGA